MSATESSSTASGTATRTIIAVGRSRGWQIGFGAVTVVAGLLMLFWPGATLLAVAVVLGLQLIVAGVLRIMTAFAHDAGSGGTRALFLLLGLLLVIVGILCLRAPLHTIAILVLLFGMIWIVSGVIELFYGLTGGGGWAIGSGVISVLAGIIVLAYPVSGVVTMIWLFGIALVVIGVAEIVWAVSGARRSASRTRAPGTVGPVTP